MRGVRFATLELFDGSWSREGITPFFRREGKNDVLGSSTIAVTSLPPLVVIDYDIRVINDTTRSNYVTITCNEDAESVPRVIPELFARSVPIFGIVIM
jgi:hypothetical protein